jgi:hypothetical protein
MREYLSFIALHTMQIGDFQPEKQIGNLAFRRRKRALDSTAQLNTADTTIIGKLLALLLSASRRNHLFGWLWAWRAYFVRPQRWWKVSSKTSFKLARLAKQEIKANVYLEMFRVAPDSCVVSICRTLVEYSEIQVSVHRNLPCRRFVT